MNKLFFDLETTDKNAYQAEIITAYFLLLDKNYNYIVDYNFESRVLKWNTEAESIHKITYDEMLKYPDKSLALNNLSQFLLSAEPYECYLFANPNTEMGFLYYDVATLQMELMNHLQVDRVEMQSFRPLKIYSIHTQAKDAKDFYVQVRKNNRAQFNQEDTYKALFNEEYNAHNAKADVEAMLRIHLELNRLVDNKLKNQMEMF